MEGLTPKERERERERKGEKKYFCFLQKSNRSLQFSMAIVGEKLTTVFLCPLKKETISAQRMAGEPLFESLFAAFLKT